MTTRLESAEIHFGLRFSLAAPVGDGMGVSLDSGRDTARVKSQSLVKTKIHTS
jgi:hypothetical protein